MGNETSIQVSGLAGGFSIARMNFAEPRGGRAQLPVRRFHPGNAAAFLIDQDRRGRIVQSFPQALRQRAQLLRTLDVARKDDEPPWLRVAEESKFFRAEHRS